MLIAQAQNDEYDLSREGGRKNRYEYLAVREGLESAAKGNVKSRDCSHRVSFKSILLARAETNFVGALLDDPIESIWDEMKLFNVGSAAWIVIDIPHLKTDPLNR